MFLMNKNNNRPIINNNTIAMKKKFSIKRVALLLQQYFLENLNRELIFWLMITFLFTVLDHRDFVLIIMFISGLLYSFRLQKDFFRGQKGMLNLLIPATPAEKITTIVILNTIYNFGMVLLSYAIGNMLVILIYHGIVKMDIPVSWDIFEATTVTYINGYMQAVIQNVFWNILGYFAFFQAVFMLGTIYFKKYAILKTIFSAILIGLFLFLVQMILFKSIWDIKYLSNAILPAFFMISDGTIPEFIKSAINYGSFIFLPFLWLASYVRLTERQI